ncbi:MAG TPA: extracellular solute-binding protein [Methylomirabilota bacterium]|nr:extracellular solute-binding protein [Methylomirabilota bacterium]
MRIAVAVALLLALAASAPGPRAAPAAGRPGHGLSMHGDLKYPPGFAHFDYVNPRAPRGGKVTLAAIGTFDSLHPFILKGVAAAGIGAVFDSLTVQSADEPFSEYGLVAETIETPPDRSWVAYTVRPQARFHDGSPVTVEDVIWTFETLRAKGHPFYRSYYRQIASVEKAGPRRVLFTFKRGENRELPLIVGQMPVLPKAYWAGRDFAKTTLEAPLGSGAYRVESFEPGRSITYRRVPDYWAAELPVSVGRFNFDVIRYDYYRDGIVALEAFKAGAYDFRQENSAKSWARGYDVPAVRDGRIRKEQIRNEVPTGMQGFVYNTRRPVFGDPRVRQALARAFDFEWANAHLFYGAYTRTRSYFSNSELAARGLPGPDELAVLAPFRGRVPDEVFTKEYRPPSTAPGGLRPGLVEALRTLKDAGWVVRDMRLVNAETERQMAFEILIEDANWERITLPFVKNLERLGIAARLRTVDAAQYEYRLKHFDFDVTVAVFAQSLSPGNEQADFWGSEAADTPGSRNLAGIRDPVVDALVASLIAAPDRRSLVARTRALDRVLLWSHYVVPHWHITAFRVAYWNRFGRPAVSPKYELGFDTWWIDPRKTSPPGNG